MLSISATNSDTMNFTFLHARIFPYIVLACIIRLYVKIKRIFVTETNTEFVSDSLSAAANDNKTDLNGKDHLEKNVLRQPQGRRLIL